MNKNRKKNLILVAIVSGFAVVAILGLGPDQNPDAEFLKKDNTYFAYAEQIVTTCKEDIRCAIDELNDLDKKTTERQTTLNVFLDVVRLYDESDYKCHKTSHHLGLWLYGYTTDIDEAIQYIEMLCGGGIFHGVFENYFITQKFNNTSIEEINIVGLCSKYKDSQVSINLWQCIHGVGHGLINFYDYDVFDAVERCDEFKPGLEQISCSKGIFMQNVIYYYKTEKGDFNEDIYYPCDQVDSKYAPACYHYHSSYILKQNGGSVRETFDTCDEIPREELVRYCYYGIGRQLASEISELNRIVLYCENGSNSEYYTECIRGALMTAVNGNMDPATGFFFCKNIPDQYKANCYEGLGQWVMMLDSRKSAIIIQCIKAGEYQDICIGATLENIRHL